MKRTLSILGIGLVLLVILGLALLRLGAGWLVGTDEFRQRFNDMLEKGLRSVLPGAMTDVASLELSGLATLEIHDVTVRSGKDIAASLHLPRAEIRPELRSLFGDEPLRLDITASTSDGGRLTLDTSLPKTLIGFGLSSAGVVPALQASGQFEGVDAVSLNNLVFPEATGPSVRLTQGRATGTFQLIKPFAGRGALKTGELKATLTDAVLSLGGSRDGAAPPSSSGGSRGGGAPPGEPPTTLAPTTVNLSLTGFVLKLQSPLKITERTGDTTFTGSLELPSRVGGGSLWDVTVAITGSGSLASSLERLFRCHATPGAPAPLPGRLHVKGPMSGPHCD